MKNEQTEAEFYKPEEFAATLGCSITTAMEIIKSGQIPCIKLGERLYRVPKKLFWEWMEKHPNAEIKTKCNDKQQDTI